MPLLPPTDQTSTDPLQLLDANISFAFLLFSFRELSKDLLHVKMLLANIKRNKLPLALVQLLQWEASL